MQSTSSQYYAENTITGQMKITLLPATAQGENKIGRFNYDQERVPRENALLLEANCVCSSNMPATAKTEIFRSENE